MKKNSKFENLILELKKQGMIIKESDTLPSQGTDIPGKSAESGASHGAEDGNSLPEDFVKEALAAVSNVPESSIDSNPTAQAGIEPPIPPTDPSAATTSNSATTVEAGGSGGAPVPPAPTPAQPPSSGTAPQKTKNNNRWTYQKVKTAIGNIAGTFSPSDQRKPGETEEHYIARLIYRGNAKAAFAKYKTYYDGCSVLLTNFNIIFSGIHEKIKIPEGSSAQAPILNIRGIDFNDPSSLIQTSIGNLSRPYPTQQNSFKNGSKITNSWYENKLNPIGMNNYTAERLINDIDPSLDSVVLNKPNNTKTISPYGEDMYDYDTNIYLDLYKKVFNFGDLTSLLKALYDKQIIPEEAESGLQFNAKIDPKQPEYKNTIEEIFKNVGFSSLGFQDINYKYALVERILNSSTLRLDVQNFANEKTPPNEMVLAFYSQVFGTPAYPVNRSSSKLIAEHFFSEFPTFLEQKGFIDVRDNIYFAPQELIQKEVDRAKMDLGKKLAQYIRHNPGKFLNTIGSIFALKGLDRTLTSMNNAINGFANRVSALAGRNSMTRAKMV